MGYAQRFGWMGRVAALTWFGLGVGAAAGCGPITFQSNDALVVVGELPAPPPPERKAKLEGDRVEISEKVQFEFDKARIKPESHGLLDDVIAVLKENPQIDEVSIEGHTDSIGPASYNKQLSSDRAAAVRQYLVDHGIDDGRLVTRGWGEKKPIADNDSESGQATNRRVEFLVTKRHSPAPADEDTPAGGSEGAAE